MKGIVKAGAAANLLLACSISYAQQTPVEQAGPLKGSPTVAPGSVSYSPPTNQERFKAYTKSLFSVYTLLEAGVQAGVQQAKDSPKEWPQGAEGYGDRYGSTVGRIALRSTTQYLAADLLGEDLRFIPCGPSCNQSKFTVAFKDTFMARKGQDGHRSFSIARLAGALASGAIVTNTWYPAGYGGKEIFLQASTSYGSMYLRNLIREIRHR